MTIEKFIIRSFDDDLMGFLVEDEWVVYQNTHEPDGQGGTFAVFVENRPVSDSDKRVAAEMREGVRPWVDLADI